MKTAQERALLAKAEALGIVVKFSHQRLADRTKSIKEKRTDAKGGRTKCFLIDMTNPQKPVTLAIGDARCSGKDTYNKGLGRVIALGRAFAELEVKSEKMGEVEVAGWYPGIDDPS